MPTHELTQEKLENIYREQIEHLKLQLLHLDHLIDFVSFYKLNAVEELIAKDNRYQMSADLKRIIQNTSSGYGGIVNYLPSTKQIKHEPNATLCNKQERAEILIHLFRGNSPKDASKIKSDAAQTHSLKYVTSELRNLQVECTKELKKLNSIRESLFRQSNNVALRNQFDQFNCIISTRKHLNATIDGLLELSAFCKEVTYNPLANTYMDFGLTKKQADTLGKTYVFVDPALM